MSRRRPGARRRARRGFTIIEVIVAVMVLTVGVLGLAGAAGVVTRMMGSAEGEGDATTVALTRFERLRATRCPVTSGSVTSSAYRERWVVVGAVGGASYRLYDVVDTVTYAARRSTRKVGFRSVVQCLP